jgi:ABC-type glycerol-3-phosphate transport system substrate-binding protein
MFRAIRVLTIAAIIAASLAIGGSTASADTITVRLATPTPLTYIKLVDIKFAITWE